MYAIELENITKKYENHTIFDNYNLKINKGTFLGIKGPSGKGKTTLLNIMGLLEDYEGHLSIMGEEIAYKNKKKRRMVLKNTIGYLFQNYALIDDLNVYENLKIVINKKSGKNEKQLMTEALEKVGFGEEFLNKKIYTCSGGEQQRIAIARAILKNAPILILDEATAFADPDNEVRVQQALSALSKGKTVIMIAHRLSSIKDADCIYVLQNGEIVESGTHSRLIEKNGIFARMWKNYSEAAEWKIARR